MQADGFLLYYKRDEIASGVLWETHCHANFELIAVLSGDVCVTLEGKELRLGEGSAILIPPLCYHSVTVRKKCIYQRLTASFEQEAIPAALHSLLTGREPLVIATGRDVITRLCTLCKETDAAFYAPLAGALMIQLLYALADGAQEGEETRADPVLHAALAYIEGHLCERPSLDAIAQSIPCSKSLLCHRFREKMRITPKQYILQKRMALAAKLIREGLPPTQAALRVGYENYSNFYRMYQKHTGKAPSA